MIDFRLDENQKKVIAAVKDENIAGQKYARYYDENEEELSPPLLPEAEQFEDMSQKSLHYQMKEGDGTLTMLLRLEKNRHDGSVALRQPVQALGNAALVASGTPEQLEKWGSKLLAMAMTEPGCGSDTKAITTTAVRDGDEWIVNGEKIFVTTGARCDGVVIWATIDKAAGRGGIKSFIVMKGTPGFEVAKKEKKLGIRASDTVSMVFNNCRIPRDHLLGGNEDIPKKGAGGFRGAMKTFNMTRPGVAAGGVGFAQGCFDFVEEELGKAGVKVDYSAGVHSRTAIQDKMIAAEADIEASTLSILRAAWLADEKLNNNVEASVAKSKGGEISRTIPQACMEMLGSLSISRQYLVEKWFRDARITDIYEGTGEINRLIIAREILGYSSRDLM